MSKPYLSFCVPAYNEEKLLPITLSNLNNIRRELLVEDVSSELVVCDNNSTDRTKEIALSFDAKVIFESVNRISSARNAAASLAEGDYLVFVDADTFPSLELIQEMVRRLRTNTFLGGGSVLRMEGVSWYARLAVSAWNFISRLFQWGAGSFIFMRRDGFQAIGGFNTEMFAAEELDLSRRAKLLAKTRGLKWKIITKFPLVSSGRKMSLYSIRETFAPFYYYFVYGEKAFKNKEFCSFWYDGRR